MNATAVPIIFLALFGALSCTHSERSEERLSAPAPVEGKASAPVAIDASFSPAGAQLVLRFERAATDVTVGVRGLEGLGLVPTDAVGPRDFAAQETLTMQVPFASREGTLVVSVAGRFAGARRVRVVSFPVGAKEAPSTGTRVLTDHGGLKLLPTSP
jgi:hypothetical protein